MEHINQIIAFIRDVSNWSAIASMITAATSVALGYLTWILAKETRALSKASSQPHVTVTLEPNLWAIRWIDMIVENSGNAVAHDIQVSFTPPLPTLPEHRKTTGAPFQHISILRPTQSIKSNLCEYSKFVEKTFEVTVSWKSRPKSRVRDNLIYTLSLADYDGVARLGASNPAVQIAEQMKKIREDWQHIASGHRKINTNVFTQRDRDREAEEINAMYSDLDNDEG